MFSFFLNMFQFPQSLQFRPEYKDNQRNMAFSTARVYWKSMANGLRGGSSSAFTTSTYPKLRPYSPTADQFASSQGGMKSKVPKGDFFPVFMSVGMISMSVGFGLFTMYHQLGRAPNVSLRKSRRETIPEVVQPEKVAKEAEKFVKQSFFRKIAHIQDFDRQEVIQSPRRGDVLARPVKVETLKDVGVDPKKAH